MDHPGDDTATGVGYFTVAFVDAISNYDEAVFVAPGFNFPTTLSSLLDVQGYEKAVASANVLHISAKVPTGEIGKDIDIYSNYNTLFSTAALWTATNLTSNAAIAITTLALNAAGYGDMTLNSAAHTAAASGTQFLIQAVDPLTLDTNNVVGIEVLSFIYTKP
jgi:hypothetical protein